MTIGRGNVRVGAVFTGQSPADAVLASAAISTRETWGLGQVFAGLLRANGASCKLLFDPVKNCCESWPDAESNTASIESEIELFGVDASVKFQASGGTLLYTWSVIDGAWTGVDTIANGIRKFSLDGFVDKLRAVEVIYPQTFVWVDQSAATVRLMQSSDPASVSDSLSVYTNANGMRIQFFDKATSALAFE